MRQNLWINGRFLTQNFTGVQRYAWELVHALDRLISKNEISSETFDIQLVVPRGEIQETHLEKILIKQVGCLRGQAWEQVELPFYSWGKNLLCLCNSLPLLPRGYGNRLVLTMHDLSFKYYPQSYGLHYRMLHGLLAPRAMYGADKIIAVSHSEMNRLLHYYPDSEPRMKVVHHGGDHVLRQPSASLEALPDALKEAIGKPYILFVGSANPLKNLRTLIQAFEKASLQIPENLVVVGGSGGVFSKMDLSVDEKIFNRIHFLGQINDPRQIRLLYEKATLLVAPSLSESFGLPCLEAMTVGCPVMASDIPAFKEICGDAAGYIQPLDVNGMAEKIGEWCVSPELLRSHRAKGLERAKAFTWERAARETWAAVSEVIYH